MNSFVGLFKLFDLQVKGQNPTKVITVRNTPPYGHAPTYRKSGNFGHGFILAYFGP